MNQFRLILRQVEILASIPSGDGALQNRNVVVTNFSLHIHALSFIINRVADNETNERTGEIQR